MGERPFWFLRLAFLREQRGTSDILGFVGAGVGEAGGHEEGEGGGERGGAGGESTGVGGLRGMEGGYEEEGSGGEDVVPILVLLACGCHGGACFRAVRAGSSVRPWWLLFDGLPVWGGQESGREAGKDKSGRFAG